MRRSEAPAESRRRFIDDDSMMMRARKLVADGDEDGSIGSGKAESMSVTSDDDAETRRWHHLFAACDVHVQVPVCQDRREPAGFG
jgi:hypothetical protein